MYRGKKNLSKGKVKLEHTPPEEPVIILFDIDRGIYHFTAQAKSLIFKKTPESQALVRKHSTTIKPIVF